MQRTKRKRNICLHNVAWLRLQNGTLRVDLETSEVFSRKRNGSWIKVCFHQTQPSVVQGIHRPGGYWSAKLRITIDGVNYRQNCFLHRIVWMAKHGKPLTPSDQVDHGENGKQCNCWTNLERVSEAENHRRHEERRRRTSEPVEPY